MGKVARSARAITQTLWGTKGRPETNDYADRCAEQERARRGQTSLKVVAVITPQEKSEPRAESPRTTNKWAAARARHGVK